MSLKFKIRPKKLKSHFKKFQYNLKKSKQVLKGLKNP